VRDVTANPGGHGDDMSPSPGTPPWPGSPHELLSGKRERPQGEGSHGAMVNRTRKAGGEVVAC